MKKWYLILLSLFTAIVLFLFITFSSTRDAVVRFTLKEPIQIVLKSLEGQPMDFWNVVIRGIHEAGKEFDVKVELSGPRFEKEINRQINIMNRVTDLHPPLIILAASDYKRLVPSVQKAHKLGIPVVTLDSGVDSSLPVSFIATDNVAAGIKAGKEMLRLLAGRKRTTIAIVSHIKETATAIDREKGVRKALQNKNILGTWFCDVEQDKAYHITLKLIKNSSLGGIIALNEVATLGVAQAIEEKGLQNKIIVVGFDNAIKELSLLEAGVIKATVVQQPYNMGYMAVKMAVEYLKGQKVAKFIDTGSILITKKNMFKREYQEILFPFGNK